MLFEQKNIPLRDGRTAVLRTPEITDAAELIDYMRDTAGETPFLMRMPEEVAMTVAMEEHFISMTNESEHDVMIVCEVDGRLAGTCKLSMKRHIKSRHRGTVGIALRREFWGLGIGTAMMEAMVQAAREKGLMQLELEFIEGNSRARALYEKFGFRIVGMRPNATRLTDGTLLHEYIMVKEL